MSRHYLDLALTASVRAQQTLRAACAAVPEAPRAKDADVLSRREIDFIEARDSFYLATVSETGWPYVQHRGGPPGFVRHLDETSFGWAEYAGNRQYISLGNTAANDRVALIFVDYPNRRRLKVWGRLQAYGADARPDLALRLDDGQEDTRAERLVLVAVEAFDWNCPRHITPRFTTTEIDAVVAPPRARAVELEPQPPVTGPLGPASRRRHLFLGAGVAAAAGLIRAADAQTVPSRRTDPQPRSEGTRSMNTVTTPDGTQIYYKDWGRGRPVVFSHGWPLSADAFEDQMFFLAERGFRCIAHDRRGHGRSSQPWHGNDLDTYADDLAAVVRALDLRDAIHVGHSTGGGEVARYIGRHGTGRVAKAVLIGAIPPLMLTTAANPGGLPIEVFDQLRSAVQADRSQFWRDLSLPFYGYNRPDAKISEGVREAFWLQGMMAGFPASYYCIKAFSETDLTEDLGRFDVPTLVLHGSDDQIVPIGASAMQSSKLIRNATLKVYDGAPHGMCTTLKDRVNAELLAFLG